MSFITFMSLTFVGLFGIVVTGVIIEHAALKTRKSL